MPSFFLFSFVSCLYFVCKVCQGTSSRGFGGVQLHIYKKIVGYASTWRRNPVHQDEINDIENLGIWLPHLM